MKLDTKYLHYEIHLNGIPVDWNTTICDSLSGVHKTLKFLDIYFDDPELKAEVTIRGIGMTIQEYKDWKKDNDVK